MKLRLIACAALVLSLSACSSLTGGRFDLGTAISAGGDVVKAGTLDDKQMQSLGLQSAKQSDSTNQVAPAGSKYAARLQKITSKYTREDGLKLEFKAYLVQDVNAFALPNGSVRVYAGLMDKMNDDELLFVIGHEIGHVKLGHSKAKMQMAYGASALRKGVSSSNSMTGVVAASDLGGGFLEEVINSQFSQSEEEASDDYGLAFLKKHKLPALAASSALMKLAKISGGKHSFLSSHPDPEDRAKRIGGK